ncbi:MAG: hypothetical protein ACI8R4_004029, partial [Paracoccaceae bacterium]
RKKDNFNRKYVTRDTILDQHLLNATKSAQPPFDRPKFAPHSRAMT